ncbi:MAG: DUF4129 domain-containing protein [Specibacter sp.]
MAIAPFAALAALTFDVPVTPGADEARRWAAEELAKKAYKDAKPGLAGQIVAWLKEAFNEFLNKLGALNGNVGLLVAMGVVVVVAIACVLIIRPRLNRRKSRQAAIFDGPVLLTAAGHRTLARSAVERGDLATAVSEQFRAMVRAAEERAVITPTPGRTAAEVAADLGRAFPLQEKALARATEIFNSVRYGHADPTLALYEELLATDNALAAAKPVYDDGLVAL